MHTCEADIHMCTLTSSNSKQFELRSVLGLEEEYKSEYLILQTAEYHVTLRIYSAGFVDDTMHTYVIQACYNFLCSHVWTSKQQAAPRIHGCFSGNANLEGYPFKNYFLEILNLNQCYRNLCFIIRHTKYIATQIMKP